MLTIDRKNKYKKTLGITYNSYYWQNNTQMLKEERSNVNYGYHKYILPKYTLNMFSSIYNTKYYKSFIE